MQPFDFCILTLYTLNSGMQCKELTHIVTMKNVFSSFRGSMCCAVFGPIPESPEPQVGSGPHLFS